MQGGEIIIKGKPVAERRNYYLSNLQCLNETQTRLINPHFYKVDISDELYDLKNGLIESLINEIKNFNEE